MLAEITYRKSQNLAERDLRPTVIARKVSFGSQSDAVVAHLKGGLDRLADDIHQDPWPLLFPEGPT
jgi:hypothetical protein